ncbi:MAG: hypothetical protein LBQ79_09575 [Deltaproteobacteria bacterium]|jgi:hypothetical protein|nr:hypothetical protein [Deltaproteobacteria bacterium]
MENMLKSFMMETGYGNCEFEENNGEGSIVEFLKSFYLKCFDDLRLSSVEEDRDEDMEPFESLVKRPRHLRRRLRGAGFRHGAGRRVLQTDIRAARS